MRTHANALAWWLGIGAVCFLSLCAVVNGQELPKLETLDQYTRIQIPVTSGSAFRMLSGKTGEVTLVVDRVATGALDSLPRFTDSRIKQVSVKTLGLDKAEVTVRFSDVQTESFAYAQGNNIVLDLWHGNSPKAAPVVAKAKLPAQVKKVAVKRIPASAPAAPSVPPLKIDYDLFQRF
ncbi:MAG: hypothetical protein ACXVCS_18455, partial [Bdellovibrionota bacterium]